MHDLAVYAESLVSVTGHIVEISKGYFVKINHKKPRRSKTSQSIINWNKIVLVRGHEGETGTVVYKSLQSEVLSGKGDYGSVEADCVIADIGGSQVIVNTNNCSITVTSDDADSLEEKPVRKKKRRA